MYIEQISYLIYLKLLDEETNRELQASWGIDAGNSKLLFPQQSHRWFKWRFKSGPELRDFRDEVFLHGFSGER